MSAYTDAIRAEALSLVNETRVAFGLASLEALPQGACGDPGGCPIAVALGPIGVDAVTEVDVEVVEIDVANRLAQRWGTTARRRTRGSFSIVDIRIPSVLKRFVESFDDLQFPDLIAPLADWEDPEHVSAVRL